MSPLLVPVLAQIVVLQIGDRTEARYVKYDVEQFEGSTSPRADLSISSRRSELSIGYGPTLTLVPLERKPRELLVFHEASATTGYRFKTTRISLTSSLGLGEVNFRVAALRGAGAPSANDPGDGMSDPGDGMSDPGDGMSDPGTGTADPGTGPTGPTAGAPDAPDPGQVADGTATGQLRIVDRVVQYYTSTTTLSGDHDLARDVSLNAHVGHTRAGGLEAESRSYYPTLSGWFAGGAVSHAYRLAPQDSLSSSASLVKSWSSNGNEAATLNLAEDWQHVFDKRTSSSLGAGLNVTRFSQSDGLRGFSVFPTFQASLSHRLSLWRGTLSVTTYAYSTPALDPLRALVDPRVGVGGNVGYYRRRFSINVNGNGALSLAPEDHDAGAVDSVQLDGRIAYRVAELVEVDAGARYARQAVQDVTVLPSSYAAFVGLNVGYLFYIHGRRR